MARKPIQRSLPPLATQVPGFQGLTTRDHKRNLLSQMLRQIAIRNRRRRPHPFYSMREVARFFHVTLPTVGAVYKQLEREGLLLRRRSSMTELVPVAHHGRQVTRGVVAVPIWLPGFLALRCWRQFFIHLEQELRQRGFVANLIFFRQSEQVEPEFVDRVLLHEPEFLMWFCPSLADRSTLAMIAESGVRALVIGDNPEHEFRGQKYSLSWERGLDRGLAAWKQRGIRSVIVPQGNGHAHPSCTHVAASLLARHAFPREFAQPGPRRLTDYLERLGRRHWEGVFFDDDLWFTILCAQEPRAVARLLLRSTILVTRRINLAPAYLGEARVDVLLHDLSGMASRIAQDLDSGKAFTGLTPVVFEAEWQSQVLAADLARHFGPYSGLE